MWKALALVCSALALVAVPGWMMYRVVWGPPDSEPQAFDAALWRDPERMRDGSSPRLAVVPDLVRRHLHHGTDKAVVLELLGEPVSESWSRRYPYPWWSLGVAPGSSDGTGLLLEFDEEDRLRAVYAPYWGGLEPYDGGG